VSPSRALLSAVAVAVAVATPACSSTPGEGLSIGAKDFAEQEILGEMLLQVLGSEFGESRVVPCVDTYECQRDLRHGGLDLMVEYSGTALQFMGGPPADRDHPIAQVRALYEPVGIRWLEPLGFDNGYRLLVPTDRALTLGLETIADLERVPGEGLRVACPGEFLRRPRDGLAAVLRRYGLRLAGEPVVIEEPAERFEALLSGRADVAVGYATDGAITGRGLTVLGDPLGFFPPYQASIVVRADALRTRPGLEERLDSLEGRLDTTTMRSLNYRAQVEGHEPREVAEAFLVEQRLVPRRPVRDDRAAELVVVVHEGDDLEPQSTRALATVRRVYTDHPVRRDETGDVAGAVASSRALLAVVGAERFFPDAERREDRMEAVAVLGTRLVHLLRRANEATVVPPLSGRIGVPPAGSGGERVGLALLAAADDQVRPDSNEPTIGRGERSAQHHVRADARGLVDQVLADRLDGALVLAEGGDAEVARLLDGGEVQLRSLDGLLTPERAVALPYLSRARIPAGTYVGQHEAVETVGVQVVLAAAATRRRSVGGGGGPAAALPAGGRRLPRDEVEQLYEATGALEVPDPSLPSAWTSHRGEEQAPRDLGTEILDAALNVGALAFIAWLTLSVIRRKTIAAG